MLSTNTDQNKNKTIGHEIRWEKENEEEESVAFIKVQV